jgi:hypothetical protein
VAVARPIPQIHRLKLREVFLLSPLENAFGKNAAAHFGKNGEDLDFQADLL